MIIDAHTHGIHGGYLDKLAAVGGEWAEKRFQRMRWRTQYTPQFWDVALRVEQLEQHGIDRQLVTLSVDLDSNSFPGDAAGQLAVARALNDNLAKLQEDSKGRLLAAGSVPLGCFEQGGRQEMDRAIKELGLKAIAIASNINGKPVDLPEYEPFWAYAAETGTTVYTHPWAQPGRPYEEGWDLPHTFGWPYETTIMIARLVFSGVMERCPGLKIVTHHLGGGMIPFFMGRIDESNDPTATVQHMADPLPRPLYHYFSQFYFDSAVGGSAAAIKCAYEVFGADHIIFATDAPNGPQKGLGRLATYPDLIRSLGLSQEETDKILAGNAARILNLD